LRDEKLSDLVQKDKEKRCIITMGKKELKEELKTTFRPEIY